MHTFWEQIPSTRQWTNRQEETVEEIKGKKKKHLAGLERALPWVCSQVMRSGPDQEEWAVSFPDSSTSLPFFFSLSLFHFCLTHFSTCIVSFCTSFLFLAFHFLHCFCTVTHPEVIPCCDIKIQVLTDCTLTVCSLGSRKNLLPKLARCFRLFCWQTGLCAPFVCFHLGFFLGGVFFLFFSSLFSSVF